MATDDEWVVLKPGEEPPPAASSGPSASEWMVLPPGDARRAPEHATAGDPQTISMRALNQAGMGIPNRVTAVKRALTGESPSYDEALRGLNESQQDVRERYPWTTGFADAGAGVGTAVGAGSVVRPLARAGAPLWERIVGGAAEGGIWGGAHGAGTTYTGKPEDYARNAGLGSILGMGFGAAAPAVGAGGSLAWKTLADRGWFGGLPKVLTDAGAADARGLRDIVNMPNAMPADAGPSMKGLAQGSVIGEGGEGRSRLINNLNARNEQTGERIVGDLDRIAGRPVVPSHTEAGIQQRMTELGDQYGQVLANARAVDTQPLHNWLTVQINNTAGPGQATMRRVRGELDIPDNPGVLDPHPERLHALRSSIKRQIRDHTTDADSRAALELIDQRLTQELQAKVPGLRELDSQYAELGSQLRAIQPQGQGRRAFQVDAENVVRPVEMQETLTAAAQPKGVNVGPSAEGFRMTQATRAELDRIVGTNKNDLAALDRVLAQPQDWNAQKLAIMFGQERADAIAAVIAREKMFRQTHGDVAAGSQTAPRAAAAAALDAGTGKIPWDVSFLGALGRGAQGMWDAARTGSSRANRDRIAGWMAEQDRGRKADFVDELLRTQGNRDVRAELARRLTEQAMTRGMPTLAGDDNPLRIKVTPKKRN